MIINNCAINPLFSSPVIEMDVEQDTDELKDVKEYTKSRYEMDKPDPNINIRILENHPKIADILLHKFKIMSQEVIGYNKKEYFITTSWITSTTKGQRSQFHNHRNSFWSGVYYFQDEYPRGTAGIQFENPVTQMWDVWYRDPDIKNYNEITSTYWNIFPKPKQLLFFPSYLKHSIMLHEIDTVRCSLAFNIMPLEAWGCSDSTYNFNWALEKM
jgi:predicted DNA binding CopG/RHH family protein